MLNLIIVVPLLLGPIEGPPPTFPVEVADVARSLDAMHKENWKPAPGTPEPSRVVTSLVDARVEVDAAGARRPVSPDASARAWRLNREPNGWLCFAIGGLDFLATSMLIALAQSDRLSAERVQVLAEQISGYKSSLGRVWDDRKCGGGGGGGGAAQREWDQIDVQWDAVLGAHPGAAIHRETLRKVIALKEFERRMHEQAHYAMIQGLACAPAVCETSGGRPTAKEALIAVGIFSLGLIPLPAAVAAMNWPVFARAAGAVP